MNACSKKKHTASYPLSSDTGESYLKLYEWHVNECSNAALNLTLTKMMFLYHNINAYIKNDLSSPFPGGSDPGEKYA